MRSLEDQDHYEVLEISRGARIEEIESAYPIVREAYEDGSLATYSVFDAREKDAIRQRIDLAYNVLSDVEARDTYDRAIGLDAPHLASEGQPGADAIEVRPAIDAIDALDDLDEIEDLEEEENGEFDGPRLRRARLRRGIEIDQIAEITRINPRYLRCIEADAYGDLPAAVYTRGFVTAYARAIGLEPQAVAKTYMALFGEARGEPRGGGLLFGRREQH
jgi:hypothetical protein